MYDLAVRAYSNALADKRSMDEEKKELLYLLGITYEMMGKKEEAIEQFKLIYEVDIDYRDVVLRMWMPITAKTNKLSSDFKF
jgi:tetratricopeptide (TPR) repeat protein